VAKVAKVAKMGRPRLCASIAKTVEKTTSAVAHISAPLYKPASSFIKPRNAMTFVRGLSRCRQHFHPVVVFPTQHSDSQNFALI
jgi:hypothetical protein